jgi:hypothetical protein
VCGKNFCLRNGPENLQQSFMRGVGVKKFISVSNDVINDHAQHFEQMQNEVQEKKIQRIIDRAIRKASQASEFERLKNEVQRLEREAYVF